MAPLSIKIVKDDGAVTRKVKLDPDMKVWEAHQIVQDKFLMPDDVKDVYGLFLRSPDNELSGIWLEAHRTLSYYMLRNEDRIDYMSRIRNLRVRMLDDTVKTLQVDQSKTVSDLMISICGRIGITNPEEYGLCLDSEEESEESKENKSASGTLTLKKKSQLKDRDLEFEQLSKKLKTDDNVEWIDLHKTLSEACIEPRRTLLLKRRLFYSDRNVDSRDPVQLNLLYVQARDNILNAVHPVTEEKAAEFAGIQCQIHFGDFQEDKHKPGFLENLSEYLPEQYSSSWGIEKKILKEYRKHQGVSQLDAKYLYTKTARAMPTYGVTFFLVKEKQKDKKKLVPRLLGINAESVLRLDERSKEILQVWPLTHVRTYHPGKGETFTLNFGDYSDKEYSVKTRDAYRIRDILEGYIDIIRRRMLAAYSSGGGESGLVGEENMSASSANVVQHVSHKASQQIEHCIVGPTRIVPHEPGQQASTGTQIVTVQQIITTHKAGNEQTAVTSDVPLRSDMSMPFTRRLNRLNSNAVKVVSYLTEQGDLDQARRQVLAMLEDMPVVRNGVRETIDKQSTDDARKKLEDQLQDLEELMKTLDECTVPEKLDKDEAVDVAKNIADVTTQIYFSMDPNTKRRSQLLRNSRASFIEDERTEKSLRRASFIAATATAINTLDQAVAALHEKHTGPKLTGDQVPATEQSAVDNLAKLNAAIAHYLMGHADPKNVDYGTAVTSMNTIHEFMPELVNDVKALASTKDEQTRRKMLADLKALCEATGKVCATVGSEDPQKIQEASKAYSDVSGKLMFAFGRGSPADKMKKDKVIDLAKDVQSQAESLVKTTSPLAKENTSVQTAGDGLNVAATRLVDQAELTGSTLHEPHCQSALTAAAESVSSSAQHLSAQCRPLLEDQHQLTDALHHRAMALAHALDALKAHYVNDEMEHQKMSPGEIQRLKFIKSASGAKKQLVDAEKQLHTALPSAVNTAEVQAAQRRLADRLAQLNAAMASLIAATADRDNPDYATAELAINTISELMPGIVHDSKISNFDKDPASRADMMEHIKALCDATGALCHTDLYDAKGSIGDAVDKFKDASGKLVYTVSHRVNPEKEQEIVQLAAEACGGTSELLCGVQQLAEDVGGEVGEQLDAHGAQLADSAQQLLTLAQVTAPSISDRRCQSVLLAAADKVADCSRQLADCWTPLSEDKRHAQRLHQLQQAQAQLQQQLDKLRAACHSAGDDVAPTKHSTQQHRLKFMKSNAGAQQQMKKALEELNKPLAPPKPGSAPVSPQQLSQRLDALTAALAQLMQATRDAENPDYETAEQQVKIISELMPQIVQDTKSASAYKDAGSRAAMLEQIRALCEATDALCTYSDGTHPQELSDAVSKFSASSGKLVLTLTPARDQDKGQQVVELSAGACATTSEFLCGVQQLAEDVGGEVGEQLDAHGAQLADSAQQLLTLAQVTAPSISDRRCQSVLLAAADKVADCSRQLADCWTPLSEDKRHAQRLHQLQQAQAQLQQQLDKLRAACYSAGDDVAPTKHSSQEHRLKFMKSNAGAQQQMKKALDDLNKPLAPPKPGSAPVSPQQLSQRLDALTAALAQLMQATRDPENPDYETAEQQVKIISELMPHIVQDTKSASASKDAASRAAMLEQIRALCEATDALCQYSDGTYPQELSDAVAKFSASSGKLVFTLTPARDQDKGQQVVELSAGACATTSELLCGVQQLTEDVGGEVGEQLDAHGAQLADSAQQLLTLAQVTAPSISDRRCQSVLLAAADKVADCSRQLADCWTPLSEDKRHAQRLHQLQQAQAQLQQQLDKLRAACHSAGDDGAPTMHSSQEHRLKFMKSNAGAQQQMKKVLDDLNKPLAPPKPGSAPVSPQQLSQRLDALTAALAQLMQATRDAENPDYETAEQQVKIISELMPQIVQDTKSASASKDAAIRAAMLEQIRALCDATDALCQYSDGTHPQELSDAVAKFSAASGKLVFTLTPARDQDKGQQVVELSAGACATTSELLWGVQQLTEDVGGEVGEQLDAHGAQLADSAQQLLTLAQVTAPSISDRRCQSVLLAAADKVADCSRQLADCWTPLSEDKRHAQRLHQLQQAQTQLQQQLDKLRAACHSAGDDGAPTKHLSQEHRLKFMKSNAGAQQQMKKALDDLNEPLAPPKPGSAPVSPQQLSQRLDALTAALAQLMQATRDPKNPDYETAEQQVNIISELMPQILQDTKAASATKDAKSRAAMLEQIRSLCEATDALCQYSDGTHQQELSEAVSKFSASSGKLAFTLTPARDQNKGQQVVELSAGACATTSELLCGVQQLTEDVGGEVGEQLDAHGAQLADSAQQLLTLAQVTAPSISDRRCQSVLLAAADKVADCSRQLADCWTPLSEDKRHAQQLDKLRAACHSAGDDVAPTKHSSQEHKLKFMKSNAGAQQQMKKALDDLNKPLAPPKPGSAPVSPQQLSQRLDALTAALAQLMQATRDAENPDFETAEQQVKIISELMPQIVQDTRSASASKDAASRSAMLEQIRALCEATNALCQYTDGTHPQELSEAVSKFSASSDNLVTTFTPARDQAKGQQVVKLSAGACATTSELLCGVQQLTEDVGGEVGEQLDAHGAQLADSAQQLLTLAQVTAPSISDRRCQSVLLAAADKVADCSRQLADCWTPLSEDKRHAQRLHQLQQAQARLQQQLDKFRNACHAADEDASSVNIRSSDKLGKPRPAVPKRASSMMKPSEADFNKQFLDTLRCEESRAAEEYEKKLKLEEENVQREQFVATVDEVHQNLLKTEQDLKKWCQSPSSTAVSGAERARLQQEMQQALARAGVDVAHLVAANYADKIDYPSASKSTAELPKLITEIAKDGKVLSGVMKDSGRQQFLKDMLQLCESTRNICDAAKNDRQKLNQSAMVFGDNSAKLLYAVSDDVDPAVEKEIISRAKAIGDSASRLALEATDVGGASEASDVIITAGTNCVDAAGKLVYTAKLVAPSIHEYPCQEALVTSASSLSLALEQFSSSWKPLARGDTTQHLYKEADNLNRILEDLMHDIKGGNIGKRREMEKLVIEDTPIRMLTLDIIEGAKQLSTSAEVPPAMQQQHEQYRARVSTALHDVDVAHARCNNAPHDAVKCSELEQAVQNLQMILLTSRPNAGNQNSNIVDLRDFIEEVSSEAQKLADAIDAVKVDAYDKKALQDIKENCVKMSTDAYKLTHPDGETGYDTTFNDILDVDTFGQDCDEVIKEINASLRGIQDDRAKKQLLVKMLPLTETCNMMRFATKSGMSASKCASLESTLSDLDDIEDRVIPSLVKQKEDQGHVALRVPADAGSGRTSQVTSLLSAARDVTVTSPRGPLTAYVATCAAAVSDEGDRNKLLEHLYKVVRLWKLQTLSANKRLAVWQQLAHPELAHVTGQLIQEIQSPESEFSASPTQSPQNRVLDEKDVNRLLLPGEPKVLFNTKKQSEQLAHMSTKLGSISSSIQSSIASPQSLARSSKETVNTACELAALARGCKNAKDPLKSEQIEESVQRMTFATYNLLKVAEKSIADPNNPNVRRRLQEACRNLNSAISKLVLASSPAPPLHRECAALALALQACAPSPSPSPGGYRPPPATYHTDDDDMSSDASGAHTMSYQNATDALYEQQNVLNKMNNDQLQCRLEFAKTLHDVTGAVRRSSEYAVQCAYLLSISESEKEVAKKGVVNVPRIERSISRLQDSCISIIGAIDIEGAKEETTQLKDRLSDFSLCMEQASNVCLSDARTVVDRVKGNVVNQGEGVTRALATDDMDKVLEETVQLLDVLNYAYSTIDKCPLLPTAENISKETKDRCDEVINNSKSLVDRTMALVKEVESREQTETMTWTTFSTGRKKLLDAYDNLLKAIKVNGQRAGILEAPVEEEKDESDVQQKTYLETQVDIANRWLTRPMCKENIKTAGHQAVINIIDIGRKMSEELSGSEREEMRTLVTETEELLLQCSTTRDVVKYRALSESVKEMKKLVQRGVVTRVVEDLVDVGTPLEDLDILTDTEPDATKRKYILERKIAELLSQLGKVTRTARIVGLNQPDNEQLNECTKQAELLAPKLVQAAERRVNNPNDEEAIEKYKALVLEYAESIARVREMCDKSVDPMDFVQTAGDMMQRLRAESTSTVDPQKSAQASQSIIRLANRTIEVSLSSAGTKSDPELQAALVQARARLHAAAPAGARASRIHDIHASTDEIIRTTNEVESALGGENIFNKQPTEFNEKIFSVAMDLRESVREWSSRDNEVVGAARRMAVLMAHLSEHMHTDNKRALILTSKKIVLEAQEVAELAKKLAHECKDVRIKNNLLQTCERIPTISHQLKMLTTVKSSALGNQGTEEDMAAMDMLVGNAQSLMLSVQEVVKAAASASVKIMSQRGPRLKWVRKTYY